MIDIQLKKNWKVRGGEVNFPLPIPRYSRFPAFWSGSLIFLLEIKKSCFSRFPSPWVSRFCISSPPPHAPFPRGFPLPLTLPPDNDNAGVHRILPLLPGPRLLHNGAPCVFEPLFDIRPELIVRTTEVAIYIQTADKYNFGTCSAEEHFRLALPVVRNCSTFLCVHEKHLGFHNVTKLLA